MKYNFDQIIDRTNTNSLKYDFKKERNKPEDVLPLWVADMDFTVPQAVTDALASSVAHGIYGYSDTKQDYFDAVASWFETRHNWRPDPSWLVKTPGIVYAICTAIRALTQVGDAIMIQQPVYYPFASSITDNDRVLINNALVNHDGIYKMDFDDMEAQIIEHQVKMFILCSPHNPVGRVWTEEELITLGDICLKHNVIVISDEIHADFTYPGHTHHIFSSLKAEYEDISIVCTAPSKSFNLAGLQVSNIFIKNKEYRLAFLKEIERGGYSQLNTLGLVACQAAYGHGAEWMDQLKEYLAGNLSFIRDFLAEKLPNIKLVEPDGTYLVWLDLTGLDLSDKQIDDRIINGAKLWLDTGSMFGKDGSGYQRINIACPRSTVVACMDRLAQAFK